MFSWTIPTLDQQVIILRPTQYAQSYFETHRFTQKETFESVSFNPYIDDVSKTKVSENDDYILYVDESILSIYVLQKQTMYMWSSTINKDYNALDDNGNPLYENLYDINNRGLRSTLWRNRIDSPLWIGYFTSASSNPQFREETMFDNVRSTFDFTLIGDGFQSNIFFASANIQMTLQVILHSDGITYEVFTDSIIELGTSVLSKIAVYPFFGAAKQYEIDGYFMVPDGIGALIRFDEQLSNTLFEKPFYGVDFATTSPKSLVVGLNNEQQLNANTYGVVHGVNQQGYLKIVSGTPEYASLVIYPASLITDFNFSYTSYTLRSNYRQPLNQSQTNSIIRVQQDMNPISIKETIIFLAHEQANYIGMAHVYQNYLFSNQEKALISEYEVHLDILLSESKDAFIGRQTRVMTKIIDVITMINTLKASGINNIHLTLRGTSNDGYSGTSLKELPLGHHVDSTEDYKTLLSIDNLHVSLYVEPMKAYLNSQQSRIYDISRGRNLLTYRQTDAFQTFDYIHPESYLKQLQLIKDEAIAFGFDSVVVDSIGQTLYSSFGPTVMTRRDVLEQTHLLITDQGVIQGANFTFSARALYHMPLDHSLHLRFSDTIPFIPYVLRNYRHVFSAPFNFFGSSPIDVLRLIDFQMMPSYLLTKESAYNLLATPSSNFYSTRFDIWESLIISNHTFISNILNQTIGLNILSREVIDAGVIHITYEGNLSLIINYLNTSIFIFGHEIQPQSARIIGGNHDT
jgi:hypothetical protein